MLGDRIQRLGHPQLDSGERHHHRADAAFHRAPAFHELVRDGARTLVKRGLARGPARGAAHVGVELLLDGALVGDACSDAAYLAALEGAHQLDAAIAWQRADGTLRWQQLRSRLRASGLPYAMRDATRVTERVARVLAPRPRLRLAEHEHGSVERWLAEVGPRVDQAAPRMLEQTLLRLDEAPRERARTDV
jgi:hypothetical protein